MSNEERIKRPQIKHLPPVERLHELLAYDPATGVFAWKVNRGRKARAGSVAGTLDSNGYRVVKIDGVKYFAHRLAWKIATGLDPVATIDHRNRVPDDNRIANLREATMQEQSAHRAGRGASKHLGVHWQQNCSKWAANITTNGKTRYLGLFASEDDAARAYDAAAMEHHGEFANLNLENAQTSRHTAPGGCLHLPSPPDARGWAAHYLAKGEQCEK